jgi:hypothetical protein
MLPARTYGFTAAALCALIAIGSGCGGDDGDGGSAPDARPAFDASPADASTDAAPMFPLAGFGDIRGMCDVLNAAALDGDAPLLVQNRIDFTDRPYTDDDLAALTAGGREIYLDGNAGGSSIYSEMFAFEVLHRCELAELLATETEIHYDIAGPITDFLVLIDDRKIGVSVTRAFIFPPTEPYTPTEAQALLEEKLADVLESTANVSAADAWVKQILHVVAYADMHAESIVAAYNAIDPALRSDTIIWVTISDGDDAFLY